MAIKITGGEMRGRNILAPENADTIRPTKSIVRESMFNMLNARVHWDNLDVLDLFCGTGALGIEALSRGAKHVTFVDQNTEWVQKNLENLNIEKSRYTLIKSDVFTLKPRSSADIVLADPPYDDAIFNQLISMSTLAASDSIWCIEGKTKHEQTIEKFKVLKQKKFGKSSLWLLEPKGI